jgi:radial spoke head protein 4A
VNDNLYDDWCQLPDARPEHIVAARNVKTILTGNLNGDVESNPTFPGKERHFLRAQLARIFHSTIICPKGLYE